MPMGGGGRGLDPAARPSDGSKVRAAKRILRTYGETTSIKGVPKVFKARNRFIKSMWLVAVLFGGSIAAYQLTILLVTYFARPTVTRIEEKYEPPEFPDITLCNENPLSKSHFNNVTADDFSRKLTQYMLAQLEAPPAPSGSDSQGRGARGVKNSSYYFTTEAPPSEGIEDPISPLEFEEIFSTLFSSSAYFQNLPRSDSVATDIFRLFFQDCVFYSWDMKILNLTCEGGKTISALFFPDHFVCFTVSVPDEFRLQVKGVSFVLYLDQTGHAVYPEYRLNMFHPTSSGVRVVVHPRDTLPLPGDGDAIPPGHQTTIRLFPHKVETLSEPYGTCTDKKYLEYADDAENIPESPRPKRYTKSSCLGLCQQENCITQCECLDLAYTYTKNLLDAHGGVPYCGNASFIDLDAGTLDINTQNFDHFVGKVVCAIRARSEVMNETQCDCPPACEQTIYTKSIAQAPWPIVDYQLGFFRRYIFGSPLQDMFSDYLKIGGFYLKEWPDAAKVAEELRKVENKIEDNFLQLNVLFTDQIVENISEKPLMTWDKILANIGGTMNLWIGITFITIIEMSEVMYYLFWLFVGGRKNVRDAQNGPESRPLQEKEPLETCT